MNKSSMGTNRRSFIKNISALRLLSYTYPRLTAFKGNGAPDYLKE
jgi:hypothetical protein